MTTYFRPFAPGQQYLLPPDLRDWLPEDHLARFILEIVESLDLSAFVLPASDRDPRGNKAYHPALMVGVLLYAYCIGVPSSRKIEKKCVEDVAFRVLSGNTCPDHATIAGFRKRHLPALAALFVAVLRLCQEAGLVKLGHVALDGTKVKANAALDRNLNAERLQKTVAELDATVAALLHQAETVDEAEDAKEAREGRDGLPEALRKAEARRAKLQEAKAALEAEARRLAEEAAREAREKAEQRARTEAETGKKPRGRKPHAPPDPAEAKPAATAKWNETDPDSRIMKDGRTKALTQAYNAQAVATEAQIIVAAEVTQDANDKGQLEPMVTRTLEHFAALKEGTLAAAEPLRLVLSADAGYFSEEALNAVAGKVVPLVSPDQKLGECKTALTSKAKTAMRKLLEVPENTALYKKRKTMIEPIFGQIKEARGFRSFSFRGREKVDAEWKLICLTHNLLKLFRAGFCPNRAAMA